MKTRIRKLKVEKIYIKKNGFVIINGTDYDKQ